MVVVTARSRKAFLIGALIKLLSQRPIAPVPRAQQERRP